MAGLRAAELEVLFTADVKQIEKADKDVKSIGQRIEKTPIKATLTADEKDALAGMGRVEQAAKKIVSADTAIKLDADITRAERGLERAKQRLADLEVRALGGLDVSADTRRAEAQLQKTERTLKALTSARAMIEIDADSTPAQNEFKKASSAAGEAGEDAGENLGTNLVAALASIPIAGAVIGVAKAGADAFVDAFQEGLQVEVDRDRLQALTGIDEAAAGRLARAAGEAYANVFGESIESNMDTARLALQFDLVDADAATSQSQRVIQSLAGIADVLGEDVQPVARTVAQLLRTGLASSADQAFDVIAAGLREGLNVGDDLLDTLWEYSSSFASLGLNAGQSLGLMNQGLEAGAPNTDFFADSLRELGIRVREGEEDVAGFLRELGLVPGDLQRAFIEGGPAAAAGLDSLFDALRNHDEFDRNRIAVGLLGTQFEDLQFDLDRLDPSSAVAGLDGVEGSAQRMFDTLSSNDASALDQAQRNVEVAVQGMQGALATAFSDPLQEAADWISENRGPMLQFFSDLANGALDFGEGVVVAAANGTVAFGDLVSGPLRSALIALRSVVEWIPGHDETELNQIIDDIESFSDSTDDAAQTLLDTMLPALDEARSGFNEFIEPEIAMGFLNDATLRLASSIDAVGFAADGATPLVDAYSIAQDGSVQASAALEQQVLNAVGAMGQEIDAAAAAGESQAVLAERYASSREALLLQLEAMGLTREQAIALTDSILATPGAAVTHFSSNAAAQEAGVDSLANSIVTLPDGSVIVTADTSPAEVATGDWIRKTDGRRVRVFVDSVGGTQYQVAGSNVRYEARGDILEFFAQGGFHGLTPMAPRAAVVPASTWRVVGDRSDVAEAYIPLDNSPRSHAILAEAMRRMGIMPMADGGVVALGAPAASGDRPIELDGMVVAWLRQFVDGRAQIVLADGLASQALGIRTGGR